MFSRTVKKDSLINPDNFDQIKLGDEISYLHPIEGEVITGEVIGIYLEEDALEISY